MNARAPPSATGSTTIKILAADSVASMTGGGSNMLLILSGNLETQT